MPALYAMREEYSKGRRFNEKEHPFRTPYQRDRDRVVHSKAFRRLEYKTQVFVNHEGDHYRTRLTHSLEVSQISRSMARALKLNEDFAETLALSHDLGHTPFGHAGEEVLSELMKSHGGFEHNLQSLRIVDFLEEKYLNFRGLNLTFESREGIVKHSMKSGYKNNKDLKEFNLDESPPIEVDVVDIADEIAYLNHDVDDGVSSGLLDIEDLMENVNIVGKIYRRVYKKGSKNKEIVFSETIRHLINLLVTDAVETTFLNLKKTGIETLSDVRKVKLKLCAFSKETDKEKAILKKYLYKNMYEHPRVLRMKRKARMIVERLFEAYSASPDILSAKHRMLMESEGKERVISDFIAGMTDRFAIEEYRRLFDPECKV